MRILLAISAVGLANASIMKLSCPPANDACSECCPLGAVWTGTSCQFQKRERGSCVPCEDCPGTHHLPKSPLRLPSRAGRSGLPLASPPLESVETAMHNGMRGWGDIPEAIFTDFPAYLVGRPVTVPNSFIPGGSAIMFTCSDDYGLQHTSCEAYFMLYRCAGCESYAAELLIWLLSEGWEKEPCGGPKFQFVRGVSALHKATVFRRAVSIGQTVKVPLSESIRFVWWGIAPVIEDCGTHSDPEECQNSEGCFWEGVRCVDETCQSTATQKFTGPVNTVCPVCPVDELGPLALPSPAPAPAPEVEDTMAPPGRHYCTAGADDNRKEWISQIAVGDMVHESGPAPPPDSYSDFTSVTAQLVAGQQYEVRGHIQYRFLLVDHVSVGVWIDFDGDNEFEIPGEQVLLDKNVVSEFSTKFTVPLQAAGVHTRLRVVMNWNHVPKPCGFTQGLLGEVEDYSVSVST